VWINLWGWTWIDDQPWGFAPCHYGRWVHAQRGWAWAPGPRDWHRPVFAPALVAWRGDRYPRREPGNGRDMGHGSAPLVGWVPLGYNEIYEPPFHASHNYMRVANLSNTRLGHADIDRFIDARARAGNQQPVRSYVNERVPGAYTAVSRDTFISARSVARNRVTMAQDESHPAPFSASGPDVRPEPRSVGRVLPSDRPVVRPDRTVFDRPVMTAPAANVSGTHAPARVPERVPGLERRNDAPTVLSTSPQPQIVQRPQIVERPQIVDRPQTIERRTTRPSDPQPERATERTPPPRNVPAPEYHAPPAEYRAPPQPEYHAPQPQYHAPQPEYHAPVRESRPAPAPSSAPAPAPRAESPHSDRRTDRNER
jgi:hypothetical protein